MTPHTIHLLNNNLNILRTGHNLKATLSRTLLPICPTCRESVQEVQAPTENNSRMSVVAMAYRCRRPDSQECQHIDNKDNSRLADLLNPLRGHDTLQRKVKYL